MKINSLKLNFSFFFLAALFSFLYHFLLGLFRSAFAFSSFGLVNLGRLKRHVFGHTLWNYPVYCGGFTGVPRGLCAVVHTCNVIVWLSVHIKEEKRKKEMSSECGKWVPVEKKFDWLFLILGHLLRMLILTFWFGGFFFFLLIKIFLLNPITNRKGKRGLYWNCF